MHILEYACACLESLLQKVKKKKIPWQKDSEVHAPTTRVYQKTRHEI